MLQRQIERDTLPWCREHGVSVMVYWPLMKGLLTGRIERNNQLDERDPRRNWPMYQGEEWQKNQDFLDELRPIARELGKPLSEVVINWTIHRQGITSALCGAKRPGQIRENAAAMSWQLSREHTARIDAAIKNRGPIISRGAV